MSNFVYSRRFCIGSSVALILAMLVLPSSQLFAQTVEISPPTQEETLLLPFITTGSADIITSPTETPTQDVSRKQVVRVYFDGTDDLQYLSANFDVWEEAVSQQDYVTVYVSAADLNTIIEQGYETEIDLALTTSMAGPVPLFGHSAIDEEGIFARDIDAIPGFACYRTVEETYSSLSQIAADHPTLATWSDVGDSYDKVTAGGPAGYDINVLKLTNSAIPGPKPDLMIISAIHAREYTTAETATRFAEHLITNYGVDPEITWLLDYNEIHILPHANPDGRKIAEGGELWRKNRNNTYGCNSSFGVDLNRNSSFQWGGSGSSGSSCSETFRGPNPLSEPEVQAIQNYAASVFADQRGPGINDAAPINTEGIFITIHSYSELVLYPWGWSNNPAPNNDGLATLGRKFGFYNGYQVCNDCLYIADGVTDDFTYGEFGVASFTFELGTAFFQNCSTFENTIYPNNLPALIYAAKAARLPYQTPSGPDVVSPSFSEPVVTAGTPAILTAAIDDTRSNSNGQGTEPTQNIQAARYSFDTPSWAAGTGAIVFPMSAADGTFNSSVESVTAAIDTTGLSDGVYTIFVEGQDAAGNWGAPTAINLEIGTAPTILFFDNFESDHGWTTNPSGSDSATTGQWERGDPEDTNSNGPKQLGTTVSGSNDLVTARLAGASVGANDIDTGETSVRSPDIAIPNDGNTTLSFSYYMAHTSNSSADDYLRVKVVGSTTQTVLEELGANDDDDGAWASFNTSLNNFAGQVVYLLIEAADSGGGSIVEAAVDDVRITVTGSSVNRAPTALAGPDQTIIDNDENGTEEVTLDGSNSSDVDGTITNYSWTSDTGVPIPSDAAPSASFPVGVHSVILTVADDENAIATDTVVITVNAPPANQPPTAAAGSDQTLTDGDNSGAEIVFLDGSSSNDSDGTIESYAWSSDTDIPIPDGEHTSASFPVGVHNVTLTVADNDNETAADSVVIVVNSTPPGGEALYISSSSSGNVGGTSFTDEDIVSNTAGTWAMVLDMSDVSGGTEVDAFALLDDGSMLVSYAAALTVNGIAVDDSDIVRFVPSSIGDSTAGTLEMYVDGSTIGLTSNGEDIDAVTVLANGDLIISTVGNFSASGISGRDEDLLRISGSTLSLFFDGSDIGLGSSTEDIYGVWIDENTNEIFFTTRGTTSASGVTGDGADIYVCLPDSLGASTSCSSLSIYWDGSVESYGGEVMDALHISR